MEMPWRYILLLCCWVAVIFEIAAVNSAWTRVTSERNSTLTVYVESNQSNHSMQTVQTQLFKDYQLEQVVVCILASKAAQGGAQTNRTFCASVKYSTDAQGDQTVFPVIDGQQLNVQILGVLEDINLTAKLSEAFAIIALIFLIVFAIISSLNSFFTKKRVYVSPDAESIFHGLLYDCKLGILDHPKLVHSSFGLISMMFSAASLLIWALTNGFMHLSEVEGFHQLSKSLAEGWVFEAIGFGLVAVAFGIGMAKFPFKKVRRDFSYRDISKTNYSSENISAIV